MCKRREDIENNTWSRGDMEFIFECSNRYLTSERSERVRYRFEHKKINSISPSVHVFFCLLYKQIPDVYVQQFYCKMKKKLFATTINRMQLKITIKKLFYKANKTKQQCETLTCNLIA